MWAMVSPDGVAPNRMVGVSASVNLPLHHKVQKFSSGTGLPGWSRKKGQKTVVVVVWYQLPDHVIKTLHHVTSMYAHQQCSNDVSPCQWRLITYTSSIYIWWILSTHLPLKPILVSFLLAKANAGRQEVKLILHVRCEPTGEVSARCLNRQNLFNTCSTITTLSKTQHNTDNCKWNYFSWYISSHVGLMIRISWLVAWLSGRTSSLAGVLSLSCTQPAADGWPLVSKPSTTG